MPQLQVTELEFEQIKTNLKNFMRNQSEFSDYDFDGAGLNVLLDVLAYNTHYNGVLAHMLANESFIDSAIKRSSVVSIAKALGYTPSSNFGAVAYGNLTITPSPSYTSNYLTVDKSVLFSALSVTGSLSFCVDGSYSATKNSDGDFVFENIKLKQGSRVFNSFVVDTQTLAGPFTIPNENVDLSTLLVRVQNSRNDLEVTTFFPYKNIIDVNSSSKVYFVDEEFDGLFNIRFGDGIIGQALEAGNLVNVEYLVSSGVSGNNLSTFTSTSNITGSAESVGFETTSPSSGGRAKESIDSIRFNAPLYNATKGRVVTAIDYETLIKQTYANVQSVSVWGGEYNNPPIYGKVFISAQPVAGAIITDAQKEEIINNVILPRSSVSVIPEFVDPDITYVFIDGKVIYNPQKTFLTAFDIQEAANTAIETYFNTELNTLGKDFYFSKAHDYIKDSSPSIISVSIDNGLQKRITPTFNFMSSYDIRFNAKLHPRDIKSTYFDIEISESTLQKVRLADVPNTSVVPPAYSGTGTIYIQNTAGTNLASVGTVNYDTGEMNLQMKMMALYGSDQTLKINAYLHDDAKDVSTEILTSTTIAQTSGAVFAKPSSNTVLSLDDSVNDVITGSVSGLSIEVVSKVE